MTIGEMFGQSGVLVLLGMGVVFGFLIIMVFCITLMGRLVHTFGEDNEEEKASSAAAGAVFDGAVVSAITVAVKEYRKE